MKRDVDKELKEAMEELERITTDPETRELYEQREKELRDMISLITENWEEGMEKGLKQGIEQEKKEVVLNMNKEKMPIELISKIVELPIEEVEKIIKES